MLLLERLTLVVEPLVMVGFMVVAAATFGRQCCGFSVAAAAADGSRWWSD